MITREEVEEIANEFLLSCIWDTLPEDIISEMEKHLQFEELQDTLIAEIMALLKDERAKNGRDEKRIYEKEDAS